MLESLAFIAYDRDRLERLPELPISLEQDGKFLESLLERRDADWLGERLSEAFAKYADRQASGQVDDEFLSHYSATLEAAVATLPDSTIRNELQTIIASVADRYLSGK